MRAALVGLYGIAVALVALVVGDIRQTASLRVEIGRLAGQVAALDGKIDGLGGEVQAEFAKVRQEMTDRGAALSGEIREVRERLARLEAV